MGTISPTNITDGSTIDAADVNNQINTIVNEFNGGIDNANIASDAAIAGTKLASSALFDRGVNDGSGNKVFEYASTESAENHIKATNAATGNNPTISATGGDDNIGITGVAKGTGINQGWLAAKVGTFTCPGSTGNHSVTGIGFKPKLVKFAVAFTTETSGQAYQTAGAMDSTGNQWSQYSSTRAIASNNVAAVSGFKSTNCIWYDTVSAGGAATNAVAATYVSMDSDGFTINFSVTNAAYSVMWEAFG